MKEKLIKLIKNKIMKKNKQNNVTKKSTKRNQTLKAIKNLPKAFDENSPILFSLHLDEIKKGLSLNFLVVKTGKKPCCVMRMAINNKPLGFCNLAWFDCIVPENGALAIHAKIIGKFLPNK